VGRGNEGQILLTKPPFVNRGLQEIIAHLIPHLSRRIFRAASFAPHLPRRVLRAAPFALLVNLFGFLAPC